MQNNNKFSNKQSLKLAIAKSQQQTTIAATTTATAILTKLRPFFEKIVLQKLSSLEGQHFYIHTKYF